MVSKTSGKGDERGFMSRHAVTIASSLFILGGVYLGFPRGEQDAEAMYTSPPRIEQYQEGGFSPPESEFFEASKEGNWRENEPPAFDPKEAAAAPEPEPGPTVINPKTGFSSDDLESGPEPQMAPSGAQKEPGFVNTVYEVAPEFELDPELVLAVIGKESWGKKDAVSEKGYIGLMMTGSPSSAELCNIYLGDEKRLEKTRNAIPDDTLDKYRHLYEEGAVQALEKVKESGVADIANGCGYLKHCIVEAGGDEDLGLKMYFAGPGGVHDFPEKCNDYVERVRRIQSYLEDGDSFHEALERYADDVREGRIRLSANK